MIVEVIGGADEHPEVRVVDVDDLGRLHLALGEVTDEEADAALRAAGIGRLEDATTGVLDTEALRAAAQRGSDGDWERRFADMVDVARQKGWTDDDGTTLKVHVESAAGA